MRTMSDVMKFPKKSLTFIFTYGMVAQTPYLPIISRLETTTIIVEGVGFSLQQISTRIGRRRDGSPV